MPPSPPPAPAVRWDAADYHAHSSAQTAWAREVHGRLELAGDEAVLDLGCGDGHLTAELSERLPAGRVVGLDADPDMIAFARRTFVGANLSFVQGDVRTFALAEPVDRVVSTACLHWVAEHAAVLRRCRAHLPPGGRILLQMGGRGNCAGILEACAEVAARPRWASHLHGFSSPWHFHGPEEYRRWLPPAGFRLVRAELLDRPMVHDGRAGFQGWMRTTWMPVLHRLPEEGRADFLEEVSDRYLEAHRPDAQGRTRVAMVRLEVEAVAV
ncbi:MAG TPA: methyltransferase domain-containing protein [Anaeromyxobacter sp.]|nr:methyltransferase domain-containing protein [Anaeromyxobacter sp.]